MVGRELLSIWNFILFKGIETLQQYYKISNVSLIFQEETEACRRCVTFQKPHNLYREELGSVVRCSNACFLILLNYAKSYFRRWGGRGVGDLKSFPNPPKPEVEILASLY